MNSNPQVNREISNSIRVIPSKDTLWKGDKTSILSAKVILDKRFVISGKCMDVYIQDCHTGVVLDGFLDSNLAGFQFDEGIPTSGESRSIALVTKRKTNVHIKMNHDIIEAGGKFRIVVDVKDLQNPREDTYFGMSPIIIMTEYALNVKLIVENNSFIHRVTDSAYIWYNKRAKENKGLLVTVTLKDSNGQVVTSIPSDIDLKTELFYANGFPAPKYVPCTIQDQSERGLSILLKPLTDQPRFVFNRVANTSFQFRIEDVSCHHPFTKGFQLKITVPETGMGKIHAGFSDTVVVFSKITKNDQYPSIALEEPRIVKRRRASCPESILRGTASITSHTKEDWFDNGTGDNEKGTPNARGAKYQSLISPGEILRNDTWTELPASVGQIVDEECIVDQREDVLEPIDMFSIFSDKAFHRESI